MSRSRSTANPTSERDAAVSLPVLAGNAHSNRRTKIRSSRNSRKRAIALGIVQFLMLAHIAVWLAGKQFGWWTANTLTPVEPSEAMQTLELGLVNAGFIFFCLALLSTIIFGRWFCGWACHLVLLQDLCAWIMKKVGVTPRPFRSRLLIWVPLLLALYMFIWPSFKRLALLPILESYWPAALAWIKTPQPWRGFQNHLVTDDFWVTFPVIMAIPTLFICGFAAVYFLGSKGFCTYGCPYGGFFAPLDELSPARIRVTDACEGCGHCTAVCTSNVRVHEEVREYGMVVDTGCMKCLDCVSVCPNDALYFGFGAPAVVKGEAKNKRPKKQYDLSLGEDVAIAAIFLGTFLAVRGAYFGEPVPLLMAIGVAGVASFLLFKLWRLLQKSNPLVRVQSLKLKWRGRLTPAGWAYSLGVLALMAVIGACGIANWHTWRGDHWDARVGALPRDLLLAPSTVTRPAESVEAAGIAIDHLENALGWRDGGWAPMTSPAVATRLARLHAVRAEFKSAARYMERAIEILGPVDVLCSDYARLRLLTGDHQGALEYAVRMSEAHPELHQLQRETVTLFGEVRTIPEGIAWARSLVEKQPGNLFAKLTLAEAIAAMPTETAGAVELALEALEQRPEEVELYQRIAGVLFQAGMFEDAERAIVIAVNKEPRNAMLHAQLATIYKIAGRDDLAQQSLDRAKALGAPIDF